MAENLITADVEVSAAPSPHGPMPEQRMADAAGDRVRTRLVAKSTTEYVAGSQVNASSSFAETLPQTIDKIGEEFGQDIYERMATDAHIYGEVTTLIEAAISSGVRLTGRVQAEPGKEGGYGYKRSETIRAFCQDNLDSLPMHDFLFDMARCCYLGHRVAEVVYRDESGQLYIDRLKVKERNAFAFVVDSRKNVVGIVANIAGQMTTNLSPPSLLSLESTPNLLPVEKFAIACHRPTAADPRGTSLFRAAYNTWWLKSQALAHYHAYLSNYANPAVYGTTAENAPNQVDEETGDDLTAEQAMASALATIKNGWTGAFPFGSTVSTVVPPGSTGDGQPFLKAFDYYDKQLSKAILSNPLATNEGRHQARAAANEGKDVFDIIVEGLEDCLCQMLYKVLHNLVKLNFGESDAKKYTPTPELGAAEEADFAELSDAYGKLKAAGILQKAHFEYAWAKLGLPKVEMDEEPEPDEDDDETDEDVKKNTDTALMYNKRHVPSGPSGGQFAEGGGAGSGGDEGGDNSGNRTQPPKIDAKGQALLSHGGIVVDAAVQRYTETKCEAHLARTVRGKPLKDNEPIDVHVKAKAGRVEHGIEMKTMVSNKSGKINMKTEAKMRKSAWEKANPGAVFHTVVYDDRKVYNANGIGQHAHEGNRKIYYRRGFGSFTVSAMEPVRSQAHLRELIAADNAALPPKARRK